MFAGGCLCGAVRYESEADPMMGVHCHCIACRKSGGTGHSSHLVAPKAAIRLTGVVTFHDRAADSGTLVSCAFCPKCGAPIYSLNAARTELIMLRASSLDDPEVFKPKISVYTEQAPSWDHVDPALPGFPAMPPAGPRI
jgi:hypothetical protein